MQKAVGEIRKPSENFSRISLEIGKPSEKIFSDFLEIWNAVEEYCILCGENQSLGEGKSQFSQEKAVGEIRKPSEKIFLDFSEIGKPLEKIFSDFSDIGSR